MTTRTFTAALLAASAALLTGCSFTGVQSMQLPGTIGTGPNAIHLTVDLPDVTTLTPNAQVKVNDIPVGTVTSLDVENWHAVAHVSIEPGVSLPANTMATVGLNSVLGSGYLSLDAPADPSAARLTNNSVIPLSNAGAYPSTEQVLAAASVVLNGGGFAQLSTITSELNRALGGGGRAVRQLLPRLTSFVTALNSQRGQIESTITNLDALGKSFNQNRGVIIHALDTFPQALQVLSQEEQKLTTALTSVGQFGNNATQFIHASRQNLVTVLSDLAPTLRAVSTTGRSLVTSLGFALTFPFPTETATNACRGDYCNLFLTIDLTSSSLLQYLNTKSGGTGTTSGPLGGLLNGVTGQGSGLLNNLLGNGTGGLLNGLTSGLTNGLSGSSGNPSPSSSPSTSTCLLGILGVC